MIRRSPRFLAVILSAGLAMLCAPPLPRAAQSLQDVVFAARPLATLREPTAFIYRYVLRASTMPEAYVSRARMEVREVRADGRKLVWFDMFDGPNHRAFGPMPAEDQNPMLLVFLQRDVTTMANLTGGATGYFQQQIRLAFDDPTETEQLSVRWNGHDVSATRLRLRPFAQDPQIDRFPKFRDKTYEVVFAPEIPGGIYSLRTSVADPSGAILLEETLTLEAVRPLGAPKTDTGGDRS